MNLITMAWQASLCCCGTDTLLLYKKWRKRSLPKLRNAELLLSSSVSRSAKDLHCGLGSVWMYWICVDIFRPPALAPKIDADAF